MLIPSITVNSPDAKIRAVQRLPWFLYQDGMQIYEASRLFKKEKETKRGTRFLGHRVNSRKPQLLIVFVVAHLDSPLRV